MAETQTPPHQQATWQPPLYDPPPSLTTHDPGTTPSSSPYPPLPALGNGRGVATEDNKVPTFVTGASTMDEERGLLSGRTAGDQGDLVSHEGKPDLAMRGSGDWWHTWRENKRLILIRFACIVVVLFAIVALILGTISNRSETLPNPVSPGLLVHPLVPR